MSRAGDHGPDGVRSEAAPPSSGDRRTERQWLDPAFTRGLVSVILPTYNRAAWLPEALDSVLEQSHRPIELIVVDDGSSDDTEAVVAQWGLDRGLPQARFTLRYLHQANRGATAARNRGSRASHGEYLQYLDSDDVLLPGKLADHVAVLQAPEWDFVYGVREEQSTVDGRVLRRIGNARTGAGDVPWYAAHTWATEAPLFRRRVCAAVGPWAEDLRNGDEYEFGVRVKALEFRGCFRPDVVSIGRIHAGPRLCTLDDLVLAETMERSASRVLNTLERHGKDSKVERNRVAYNMLAWGSRYARAGDDRGALRCFRTALRTARGVRRGGLGLLICACSLTSPRSVMEGVRRLRRVAAATTEGAR